MNRDELKQRAQLSRLDKRPLILEGETILDLLDELEVQRKEITELESEIDELNAENATLEDRIGVLEIAASEGL